MTDYKHEFLDGLGDVVADLPPLVVSIVDAIIDKVVAKLGESPEAWRGAIEVITIVMKCMMMGRDDPDDATELNVNEMMVGLLIATLTASPWGQMAMDARNGGAS